MTLELYNQLVNIMSLIKYLTINEYNLNLLFVNYYYYCKYWSCLIWFSWVLLFFLALCLKVSFRREKNIYINWHPVKLRIISIMFYSFTLILNSYDRLISRRHPVSCNYVIQIFFFFCNEGENNVRRNVKIFFISMYIPYMRVL